MDVSAAKARSTKKTSDQRLPKGSCSNMFGRVMKTNSGPAVGSIPKLKTAGNTMMPANTATKVLRTMTWKAVACRFVSFPK